MWGVVAAHIWKLIGNREEIEPAYRTGRHDVPVIDRDDYEPCKFLPSKDRDRQCGKLETRINT